MVNKKEIKELLDKLSTLITWERQSAEVDYDDADTPGFRDASDKRDAEERMSTCDALLKCVKSMKQIMDNNEK